MTPTSTALPTRSKHPSVWGSFFITNLHCSSCVSHVETLLKDVPGILEVTVSLIERRVKIAINTDTLHGIDQRSSAVQEVYGHAAHVLEHFGGFEVQQVGLEGVAVDRLDNVVDSSQGNTRDQGKGKGISRWRWNDSVSNDCESRFEKHLAHCATCRETINSPHSPSDDVETVPRTGGTQLVRSTFSIQGMTCASCSGAINRELSAVQGVKQVDISVLGNSGTVTHEEFLLPQTIVEIIEDMGYEADLVSTERVKEERKSLSRNWSTSTVGISGSGPVVHKTILQVEGLTCASCSGTIERALEVLPGVRSVNVDLLGNKVTLFHSSEIDSQTIQEIITESGYQATISHSTATTPSGAKETKKEENENTRSVSIRIQGIFCHNCVDRITTFLQEIRVTFQWSTSGSNIVKVGYRPHEPWTIRDLLRGIDRLAPEFTSEIVKPVDLTMRSREIQRKELRQLFLNLLAVFVIAIPTFIIHMVGMVLLPDGNAMARNISRPVWGAAELGTLIIWPLATLVQFGVGQIFYRRAFAPMRPFFRYLLVARRSRHSLVAQHRRSRWRWTSLITFGNMDLLVSLSTFVAYFSSIAMLIIDIRHDATQVSVGSYFADSVYLILFILAGRSLEAYAKTRTGDAITGLGALRPSTAILLDQPSITDSTLTASLGNTGKVFESASVDTSTITRTAGRLDEELSVRVEHLDIGDTIRIPAGSLPPADGVVVSGETTFDESALTGESMPVRKTVNDEIHTGTTNIGGGIIMRVTRLGENTMLDRIISAVSDATARKAPIEKLAEQLTAVFVPAVVYFTLIVLIVWLSLTLSGAVSPGDSGSHGQGGRTSSNGEKVFWAIEFAIATLVVACPCGIGLAVPCATAVGNGIAAQLGVIAAGGGEAFVKATQVSTIVFDKTGTLTLGQMSVTKEQWAKGRFASEAERGFVMRAIRQIELQSTHPLAQAIATFFSSSSTDAAGPQVDIAVIKSTEIAGQGILASVESRRDGRKAWFAIGNAALMLDQGIKLEPTHLSSLEEWSNAGQSVVFIAAKFGSEDAESSIVCVLGISDTPRPFTASSLADLRKRGIRCVMLSGDHGRTVRAIGRELDFGPQDIHGDTTPQGKAAFIEQLQSQDRPVLASRLISSGLLSLFRTPRNRSQKEVVMFIGDGLNDAVALSAADVSLGMGHGSQIILSSSDFVLLSSNLDIVPRLLDMASRVAQRQKLNLAWACLFNLVAIPFAAGIFYGADGIRLSPVWAAIVMACSSLSVVGSSLALRLEFRNT